MACNIGDRTQQDAARRENEHDYPELVNHTEDLLCTHDFDGKLLSVNQAAACVLGYEVDEMLKIPAREFIAPKYRDQFDLYLVRIKAMGADKGLMSVVTRTGERRIWKYNSVVRTEGIPSPIVLGVARDVTRQKTAERELRASEERLRLAARAGRMYAYEWDVATDVVKRSPEYLSILGLQEEPRQLTRHEALERVHPDDRAKFLAAVAEVTPEKPHVDLTYRVLRPDGSVIWLAKSALAYFDEHGKMLRMIGMVSNITERKLAEDALSVSREHLRLALRAGRMYTWEWNPDTDRITRSPECSTIHGELLLDTGNEFFLRLHPDDRERYKIIACDLSPERPSYYQVDYRLQRPDGSVVWLEEAGHAIFGPAGKLLRIVGITADVTSRKLADEAIKDLTGRLLTAQEEERRRIARELHDYICQQIAILSVKLAATLDVENPDPAFDFKKQIQSVIEGLSDVGGDLQNLSHRLHSSQLEYLGLTRAAAGLCRDLEAQQKVEIEFNYAGIPDDLSMEISLCLFRVMQEGLQNAVKHSGVRHFWVELSGSSDAVQLTLKDLGVGFDPKGVTNSRGLGLISMRERMRLVNGEFSIQSEPGHGTTLCARIPLRTTTAEPSQTQLAS